MKHLIDWKKFKSDLKNIILDCKDILLELEDNRISTKIIKKDGDPRFLAITISSDITTNQSEPAYGHTEDNKIDFNVWEDELYRLKDYLESHGYKFIAFNTCNSSRKTSTRKNLRYTWYEEDYDCIFYERGGTNTKVLKLYFSLGKKAENTQLPPQFPERPHANR